MVIPLLLYAVRARAILRSEPINFGLLPARSMRRMTLCALNVLRRNLKLLLFCTALDSRGGVWTRQVPGFLSWTYNRFLA